MNKLFYVAVGSLIVAATSAIASIAAIAINNRAEKKVNETLEKLDRSMNDVEDATSEKITDSMIRRAVENSADKKMERFMQDTEDEILRGAQRTLNTTAKNAVDHAANDIREQTAEKISYQVANLDIEELKSRVCDQAEKHVLKKLDGCLDASAKKFQDQLDNTRKVYDGIAKAMEDKERTKVDNSPFHVVVL